MEDLPVDSLLWTKGRYSEISSFTQKVVEPKTEMEKEGEDHYLEMMSCFREIDSANR